MVYGQQVPEEVVPVAAADLEPTETSGFKVRLANFEGPFDLLLQLIGKHKLDVTEVALHQVTDDFIAYIRAMGDEWDLGEASEFLLVAATLLDLKAARLLPSAEVEDEEDLALLEARDLLFARLLQYKAYKEAAAFIAELEGTGAKRWPRAVSMEPRYAEALPDLVLGIGPERLFKLALKQFTPKPGPPEVSISHIHQVRVSVPEHARLLRERLRRAGSATFSLLVADCESTLEVVARFLALLELYRQNLIDFEQPVSLDELTVRWIGGEEAADELEIDDYEGTRPDPDAPPAEPVTEADLADGELVLDDDLLEEPAADSGFVGHVLAGAVDLDDELGDVGRAVAAPGDDLGSDDDDFGLGDRLASLELEDDERPGDVELGGGERLAGIEVEDGERPADVGLGGGGERLAGVELDDRDGLGDVGLDDRALMDAGGSDDGGSLADSGLGGRETDAELQVGELADEDRLILGATGGEAEEGLADEGGSALEDRVDLDGGEPQVKSDLVDRGGLPSAGRDRSEPGVESDLVVRGGLPSADQGGPGLAVEGGLAGGSGSPAADGGGSGAAGVGGGGPGAVAGSDEDSAGSAGEAVVEEQP